MLGENRQTVIARTYRDMEEKLAVGHLSVRQKMALACRYLADEGHASTLAGQISVRNDDGSFWTTGFAQGFAEADTDSLVRVTPNLEVLEGRGIANPAVRFHSWIYAARPELRAIVHTHPPHASAMAMANARLTISHMDMAMLHEEVAYLERWPGVPLANEEGELIAAALGGKKALFLANHGILAAGERLEEAVFFLSFMEQAARLELLCRGAGYQPIPLEHVPAAEAKAFLVKPKMIQVTFDYWCRRTATRHPQVLEPKAV